MLSGAEGILVEPSFGLVAWTLYAIFLATPALIVTALKGRYFWFLAGILTCGLAALWSAFLEPKPQSLWARRRARSGPASN